MARIDNLTNFLTDVASAIKTKSNNSANIPAANFDNEILNLPSQGNYQIKTMNITTNGETIISPDQEYDAMSRVVANVQVPMPQLQNKFYEFTSNQNITLVPDTGYDGFTDISVSINVPTGIDTSDADATVEDLAEGVTAYVNGVKLTGMANTGIMNIADYIYITDYDINTISISGKTSGSDVSHLIYPNSSQIIMQVLKEDMATYANLTPNILKQGVNILGVVGNLSSGIDTSDANAVARDIVAGQTAYVNGVKLVGTLPLVSTPVPLDMNTVNYVSNSYFRINMSSPRYLQRMYFAPNSPFYAPVQQNYIADAINLNSNQIKNGEVVLGITGTYEGSGEDLNETITEQEEIIADLKALVNRKSEPVYDVADADVYGDTLILSDSQIEKPYTELEYIQATGTQYIDTNINGSGNLRIEMMFSNWDASMDGFLCGSRTSADLNTFCIYYHGVGNPKYIRCDYDTTTNEAAQVNITNSTGMYYINKNKNVTTIKDLVLNTTLTNTLTYNNFENNLAIYIFSRNNNGEAQAFTSYYLYYFKIYDNDVLVRDFIPVQRKSDSEVCLYDKVSNTFFINQGTGAFIAGPEI